MGCLVVLNNFLVCVSGGWGYVIVFVGILVQLITHGLQLSFGLVYVVILKRWGEEKTISSGKGQKSSDS